MKKFFHQILSLFLCILLLSGGVFAESVSKVEEGEMNLSLKCKSAILIEQTTGQVLLSHNPDEKLPIASVTKIMTLLLTMEALEKGTVSLEDNVPISENAAKMGGSQVYLEPGEEISLHDVLKAVFISSANDGAVALAEMISGSVEGFVVAMNEKAKALGMQDTIFYNPTGLDDDETNLSTARDVATMSKALLAYEEIYPYTTTWIDSIRGGEFGLSNTNKLVRFYPGATGLKTGSTGKAKYCVSASAQRQGLKLCAVVLAGETSAERFADAKAMLDYGFANYAYYCPEEMEPSPVKVWGGEKDTVICEGQTDGILMTKSDAAGITARLEMEKEVDAPVKKGQTLGRVLYEKDGETVFELPIRCGEDVPALSYKKLISRLFTLIFAGEIR